MEAPRSVLRKEFDIEFKGRLSFVVFVLLSSPEDRILEKPLPCRVSL